MCAATGRTEEESLPWASAVEAAVGVCGMLQEAEICRGKGLTCHKIVSKGATKWQCIYFLNPLLFSHF